MSERDETLRERVAEVLARAGEPEKYQRTPPPERVAYYWTTLADALLPVIREVEAGAWDEGHASALGYDISYHLDREEWESEEGGGEGRATVITMVVIATLLWQVLWDVAGRTV